MNIGDDVIGRDHGYNIPVVVVFTLNRSFYPRTSPVPPVSLLILHPREIQIMWSQTERQRKTKRR